MSPLQTAKEHRANGAGNQYRRLNRMVSYPPPATGVNYNLVEKVEHNLGDRVIWHIIHSPDGSFTYDYSIKMARRRRKRCPEPDCQNFLESGQRKCIECRLATRKARNRRYYQVLKGRFKTGSPEGITIDF
jgi:hypothetical protein